MTHTTFIIDGYIILFTDRVFKLYMIWDLKKIENRLHICKRNALN